MREAIGGSLRRVRTARRRTLREVSRRARVSLGYLSEVERGRKEASSELLASICEALDIELPALLSDAAAALGTATPEAVGARPVALGHTELRLAGDRVAPANPVPMAPVAPLARAAA